MCPRSRRPRLGGVDPTARPVLRSRAWVVAVVVLTLVVLTLAGAGGRQPVAASVAVVAASATALGAVGWAVVRTGRQRRAHEAALTAWAAERAAHGERLRIARDLHDLASHGLGAITVRAAAARTATGPGSAQEHARALADIEQAGRAATTELRRMLSVLRAPGGTAPLRPADTLADLSRIVGSARAGGLTVELATEGVTEPADLSAGVQLTACAVVREGLANAARHAGPTRARVTLRREGDGLVVTVADDGPVPGWQPHAGAGQGLRGLRDRVAAVGGTLDVRIGRAGSRLLARLPDGAPEDRA